MQGKAMVKAGGILAAAVLGMASVPAQAITWNFASFAQGGTNANNFGNSYSSTSEGVTLTVTAFSTTYNAANVNFETANIANWGSGSGFGVRNRDEATAAGGLGNISSPNHSMDNAGTTDMLLLSFSSNSGCDALLSRLN